MFRRLALSLTAMACGASVYAESDLLLYFQIADNAVVDFFGTSTAWDSYVSPAGYSIDTARVVATKDGESEVLMLGRIVNDAPVSLGDGELDLGGSDRPPSGFVIVTDYASPEWSFAIELGSYDTGDWTTLASSVTLTYQQLASGEGSGTSYITTYDPQSMTVTVGWAPETYNVPEPSSGLMMLIGAGLLALRRRRR